MNVLVTGATGFIGMHVVKELAEAGRSVIAVDLNPARPEAEVFLGAAAGRVRFLRADLAVPDALSAAVPDSLDGVVHAAVMTSTPDVEARDPERVVAVNLVATVEMLQHARRARARRFLYVSSSGVYGETDPLVPVPEAHPVRLGNLYTMTKYASERVVASADGRHGLSATSIRIAAPYGPTERPTGSRMVMSPIHALVNAAIEGRAVTLGHPERTRDWTYAGDIARAIRLLLDARALRHACYNVSSSAPATLAAVADSLHTIVPAFFWRPASDGSPDIDGAAAQRRGPLDTGRIRALGFEPRYGLEQGLGDTVAWVRRMRAAVAPPDSGREAAQ